MKRTQKTHSHTLGIMVAMVLAIVSAPETRADFSISSSMNFTHDDLIDDLISDPGLLVTEKSGVGDNDMHGTFLSDDTGDIQGLLDGIILTSGLAADATRPLSDDLDVAQNAYADDSGEPGDNLVNIKRDQRLSTDISSVRFKVKNISDLPITLKFKYLFATEEYPDYDMNSDNSGLFDDSAGIFKRSSSTSNWSLVGKIGGTKITVGALTDAGKINANEGATPPHTEVGYGGSSDVGTYNLTLQPGASTYLRIGISDGTVDTTTTDTDRDSALFVTCTISYGTSLAINCGSSSAVGSFEADFGYDTNNAGVTVTRTGPFTTVGANAAPAAVYDTDRGLNFGNNGSVNYQFHVCPNHSYTVRLHVAGIASIGFIAWQDIVVSSGSNSSSINGWDLYNDPGYLNASYKELSITTDSSGLLDIELTKEQATVYEAILSGIEIIEN